MQTQQARLALVVILASVALVFALSRDDDRAPLSFEGPAASAEAPVRTGEPAGLAPALELAPDATASKRAVPPAAPAIVPSPDGSPPKSVLVRVVDKATREPLASVPVALAVRFEGQPPEDLQRAATAADGTARLTVAHFEFPADADVDVGVRIAVVGSGGTFKRFDPLDPPSKPIELRLVPCGAVEVLVVDAQGAPLPLEGEVRLEALISGSSRTRENEAHALAPLAGSRARFDFVGCSAELSATVIGTRPALTRTAEHRRARAPGEACAIQVVVDAGLPEIVGRVLDEHGAPAADARFSLALREGQRSVQDGPLTTDAQGRFRAALDPQVAPGTRVRVMLLSGDFGGWTHRADVPVEVVLGVGGIDVGDLRLVPVAGRIAGRCVDLEDEPLAGIWIHAVSAPPAIDFAATTDGEGRFELHGSSERVALRAQSEEHVMTEPVEVGPGDHDGVVIKMAPGGGIVASLEQGSQLEDLSLIVWDEAVLASMAAAGDDAGHRWTRWERFDEQGRARAGGLAPGSYRARVSHEGLLLHEVPDIAVALGVDTLDPRLADLALDHRLRTITFEVVDAGGAPVENPLVSLVLETKRITSVVGDDQGLAEVEAATEPGAEALITAGGFRPARLGDLAGGPDRRRVTLEPGIPVRLRSQTRPGLEREGSEAHLSFALVEQGLDAGWVTASVPGALALAGEALVVFPGPGRYRLGVSWSSPPQDGMSAVSMPRYDEEHATELVVREEDAETVLQIDLPDPLPR